MGTRRYHGDYNYNVKKNLVGHWPLNSTDGATDLINGNNGTLNGGMGYGSSDGRRYAIFDGVDDYINIPHFAEMDFGTGSFSVSFWIKSTDTAYKFISTNYKNPPNREWGVHINALPNTFRFYTFGGATETYRYNNSGSICTGSWVHVACVRPSIGGMDIYTNGTLDNGAITDNGVQNVSGDALILGKVQYDSTGYPNCYLSDFRIYNRVLNPTEIARLAEIIY